MLLLGNGKVFPITAAPFEGDVLIRNGRIAALGPNLTAPGARVVDVGGCHVLPGLVDPHCHAGLCAEGAGADEEDVNESSTPLTPELRAIDGIDPFDPCFLDARRAGVTTVVTGPGSANVIGGQFAAIKTREGAVDGRVLREPAAMKASLGENPKRTYQQSEEKPYTRMAIAALLRQALVDTQEYTNKRNKKDADQARDLGHEALARVLAGELPLKVHAHRADDILTAVRIAREFRVPFTIEHCTEGHLVLQELQCLKELGSCAVVGPLMCDRSKAELRNYTMELPKLLHQAGIPFAIMSDYPCVPLQYLAVTAAMAVREGLPEQAALEAITINAAKAAGVDSRVGSLEVGKDADIAVFSGHPFAYTSRCVLTLIDGQVVHEEQH